MPAPSSFDYAILRVVPRVERGECLNAGVILFCRTHRFLDVRIELDARRLAALAPDLDPDLDLAAIQRHLEGIALICAGGAPGGPIGRLAQAERFHWLIAPSSTIIQASPVHCGLCDDPRAALDDLVARLVRAPQPA